MLSFLRTRSTVSAQSTASLPSFLYCAHLALTQQSKKALNTPLHIAVKKASLKAVKLLLKVQSPVFLLRSQDGSTPLHTATRTSVAAIVQLIGDAGPEEAFQMEDGAGNTPLEIAMFKWLQASTGHRFCGMLPAVQLFDKSMLRLYHKMEPKLVTVDEVKALKDTIDGLVDSGRLRKGTKLATDLTAFADKKHAEAKKRAESEAQKESDSGTEGVDSKNKNTIDRADAIKTMEYLATAVRTRYGPRKLVHLIEVHRSVQGSLDKAVYQPSWYDSYDYCNKDEEEIKQEKAKKHSAVSLWHIQHAFSLFADDTL